MTTPIPDETAASGERADNYLKAVALIRNRLGYPDEQADRDFEFLLSDLQERADLINMMVQVAGFGAFLLESMRDIYEGVVAARSEEGLGGSPWSPDEDVEVARETLDALVGEIVTSGLHG